MDRVYYVRTIALCRLDYKQAMQLFLAGKPRFLCVANVWKPDFMQYLWDVDTEEKVCSCTTTNCALYRKNMRNGNMRTIVLRRSIYFSQKSIPRR